MIDLRPHLPGLALDELLARTDHSEVYAGMRIEDGLPIVAKFFRADESKVGAAIDAARRERTLTERCAGPGVVRVHALEHHGDGPVLVLDRIHGGTLRALLTTAGRLSLDAFFPIAIGLARALMRVHRARVVHRDVKPDNVVLDEEGAPVLIDFGVAALLAPDQEELREPGVLQGSLAYLAPEQTGRMDRGVDARTDLYALGITLFELLAGAPPFQAHDGDALSLVHAHLTKVPARLDELFPQVPAAVASVVAKLLAKEPAARYQSARGLAADLERCAAAHRAGEPIDLILGSTDGAERLVFGGELHGRDDVYASLSAAVKRVAKGGAHWVVLSGPSGTGKSAHLERIRAVEQGARVAIGRFGETRRHEPYAALTEALGSACEELLAEDEIGLATWRRRISEALGGAAAVVTEVVPALERLIGAQPSALALGPAETRNRFLFAMRRFVFALAPIERPLILALDDLHQADRGSLQLLEVLLADAPAGTALLVVSSATNAHDERLARILEVAQERGCEIALEPLERDAIRSWLEAIVPAPAARVAALAEIVTRKSNGIPIFVRHFLRQLEDKGLFEVDDEGAFQWSDEAVEACELPDDLAGLMRSKLAAVSDDARQVAAIASVVSGPFDRGLLEALDLDLDSRTLGEALDDLVATGVLARASGVLRFSHASLREQAGKLLDDEAARALEARLGWSLLDRVEDLDRLGAAELFGIAAHLVRGHRPAEIAALPLGLRARLVALLGRAGAKALGATAYDSAARYLAAAHVGVDADLFRADPGEAFAAELAHAKVLFLEDRRDDALAAFAALRRAPLSVEQHAEATGALVTLLSIAGDHRQALDAAGAALRRLGQPFSLRPNPLGLIARLALVLWTLHRRSDEDLAAIARTSRGSDEAIGRIVTAVGPAAFWFAPKVYLSLQLSTLLSAFRNGYTATSGYAFTRFGLVAVGFLKNYPLAARLSTLSAEVEGRIPDPQFGPRSAALQTMTIAPATSLPRQIVPQLPAKVKSCEEVGDLEYSTFALHTQMNLMWLAGYELRAFRETVANAAKRILDWGFDDVACIERQTTYLTEVLLGERPLDDSDPIRLADPSPRQTKAPFYQRCTRGLLVLHLLGRHDEGLRIAQDSRAIDRDMAGQVTVAEHHFLHALLAAALLEKDRKSREARRAFERCLRKIRLLARKAPRPNLHRLHLLEAEAFRLRGERTKALVHYGKAAAYAARGDYLHLAALAHERRATLLSAMGLEDEADLFMLQAIEGFRAWGAKAKVERLEASYPRLVDKRAGRRAPTRGNTLHGPVATPHDTQRIASTIARGKSTEQGGRSLDLGTVLSAAQAVSEEVTTDGVLRRVLGAALENAGATRAVLVLRRDGKSFVEAEAHADGRFARRPTPLDGYDAIGRSLVRIVERTGERVVLADAGTDERLGRDPWFAKRATRAVLGAPIVRQGATVGVLYLENEALSNAFTPDRIELLQVLATQAAISLDNAELYGALEAKVEARTRALDARNREMRLVLDNVDQGLLTIDRRGVVEGERSAVVERWLGAPAAGATFEQWLAPLSPDAAADFGCAFEALVEEILPLELLLEQMPKKLAIGVGADERLYELAYRPIVDEGQTTWGRLLIVVSDVTEHVARERAQRAQRELVQLFHRVARDRSGVEEFHAEAARLVTAIGAEVAPEIGELRLRVHTLKGNAAIYGLSSLAEACSALEDEIAELGAVPEHARRRGIVEHWKRVEEVLAPALGDRGGFEISADDVDALRAAIDRGATHDELRALVDAWSREPMSLRLARLGDQVRRLAGALGKGPVEVSIAANGVRLDHDRWAPFWGAFVHVVRNAVDHGLEDPETRAAIGKAIPRIGLRTYEIVEGAAGQLILEISDDGRGIRWEAVAAKAAKVGLPHATRDDLAAALFAEGLSTRDAVTETSGRGVGLGAVREACAALGGRIEVESTSGVGTTFRFRFPLADDRDKSFDRASGRIRALPSRRPPPTRQIA
jgi:GAF domain-containing protein/tRNA A-37 threonylcarbamoyl transferase component Bud32/HPt (histidine-containing phosphotransfer) domain-containing protein/two-component sensor histidine kinase